MSSTTHQLQGLCCSPCSSSFLAFYRGTKLNKCLTLAHVRFHQSSELVSRQKQKPLIVSAYQGDGQNNEFGGGVSKSPKHSAEVSYMPKVFEDNSLAENGPFSCIPEAKEINERSKVIHNLFSKWLTILHNPSKPTETAEGASRSTEQMELSESSGTEFEIHKRGLDRVREVVSCYFSRLDITFKITLLIFIPCYVAIRVIYGVEVLKELTPLWILGPLIVALDIKMFQAVSQLYVFSFKQAEIAIRSIPSPEKLTQATRAYFSQKFAEMKSLDFKKVANLKVKEIPRLKEIISTLFFTYSWPLYWRTVRFLARSNLI
uniref:Uncharacterized protein n=1 Tax=Kalanchoe fedtschenkoi TaxID=63787 RepID=A0A7N0T5A5_KALFE